ncbi:MAG TPA: UDP-N-acetylmuramoyl-L-alanine--D-glutamate ligase [Patescibacteria group bacterium]|nr:UDP-N-acetylmuramoyl-L-alanine--D-glutamate ligase [Patescibacteria group bacterium]
MILAALKDKKVAVLGLGIEGLATANYFLTHNIPFAVLDEKSEEELVQVGKEWSDTIAKLKKQQTPLFLGENITQKMVEEFDVIVRSPGISLKADFLHNFKSVITSHTKLFFDNCPSKIIGVTGTKGKGTTSSLIYEMLKKAGKDAYLGGNIGLAPLSFLDTLSTQSIVVLEMSSFQLQDMEKSPHISVMLMVTQEHLDAYGHQNYHASIKEYVDAKRNIVRFQTADDMAILNTDYPHTTESADITSAQIAWVSRFRQVANGCFVRDNKVILRSGGSEIDVIDAAEILLPGNHNLENVCAAAMAAYSAGVDVADMAFVLRTFKGLEHRLELVREVEGVRYYDDSFSTVPETAIAAIQAFTAPEILILGGSKKGSSFHELGKVIGEAVNIKAIIGIGVEWENIKQNIPKTTATIIEGLQTMEAIVRAAAEMSKPGDVVLLSPACASFGMFASYKDRGKQFKEQINLL